MTHREPKFSPNNAQANLEIEKYEEVFHPMIEFLRHHYISPALTMDCNVPLEYIQRAYHSAKYLKDEDKIEFMVAPATYTTLTKILLQKTLKLPKRDYYHEAPTFTQIVEMLKEIGYLGDLSGPSDFKRVNLPGIWSFLFSMLNRCITGNLGATDQAGESLLSIMWGLVKVKDIDFIDLIWEDFVATVTKNKAYVHYPRFWAIIIKKALGSAVTLTGTLPTKYVLGQFKMPSNQERWEVIPPINEEMLAIIPDNSSVLKKYRELISISKPEQTFHGSPPGRTTSSGYQQRRNPQQSSGSSDKNLPHVLSSDSSGEDLAHVLSTVSRQIEDIETSIQHPQDTAVESTCFVEPLEETPLPFDHNAHNGVIPLSVDLTNVPNNHLRFDDPMDIELDPRTDWSSDELNSVLIQRSTDHSVGSGLLFHNLEVVLGKPDTFTSVSPNLFRCASMGHIHDVTLDFDSLMIEAKQKKIGQFDVSVAAARENALSRSHPERQQQVFDITDWNSDEVNSVLIQRSTDHCMCSGLLFHNLEVVLGKPDTFTSVSPNLFRNASMGHIHDLTLDFDSLKTEAKQKKIEQRDVSARRQKRRHAKNVFKSYFRQRKNALSRRDLERQQQVFKNSISRKEFDEMKASVQELMVSVKDLLQLNLDCKKQLKEDVENYWETTEGRRIAEYDSLSEEIKGFRVHQTSFNQTLVDKISVVERKLNAISTKVDALQQEETIIPTEAISAPVQTQVPPSTSSSIIPATPLRVVPDSQISHLLTMLFNDQTESLNDKYVQFLKAVNDVPENVLIQRLAMGREIDAEKIVQAMTQFKYVVFEAYKSLYALNCKSDLLANFKFGPKVGDGTSASQPSVRKRVSGVSIIEVEPKRSKTSHDEQLSNGKGKKKSLANEDLPLPEIEDLDTTNNIVDEMQQFHEELQNGKEGIEAELKSTSEPTPEGAMKEKVVQNPDTTENIFDEVQLFDEELQNGKEGVDAEFKSTSEPTPGGAVEEKVVQDLDATENIADEMDCDEELQKSKEGIDAEFKSTSEPALGGALKEKVVQNLDTTENVVDEMEHFDEELQKNKEGVDAEFKSTCEPTPGGALKEKVVQDLDITMNIVDEIQQFHDELLKCKDGIDAEFNSTSEPTLGGALKEKVVQNLDKTENIVDEIQQFGEELENGEEGVDAELKSTSEPTPGRAVDEKVEQNLDATENIVDEMQQFDEELQKSKEEIDSEFQSTSEPIPGGAAEEKVVQILDATENIVDEMQQFDEDLQKSKEGIDSELKSTSEGINAELKSTSESTPGGSVNEKVVLRRSARIRS